jgi:hypothetical protein
MPAGLDAHVARGKAMNWLAITCTICTLIFLTWFFLEGNFINCLEIRRGNSERVVSFDLDRMREALKGPFYELPHGLTKEELRAHLIAHATSIEERQP